MTKLYDEAIIAYMLARALALDPLTVAQIELDAIDATKTLACVGGPPRRPR